ncbi:DUF6058 family natural product biosynthesis protein [Flavobacterium sp. CF136]|uniref:DUF6058 family natural product biosynthesis protein n=1 Tax=Flavobacterium sp. (strain CF136) TaxID=1144313 RepID=UPI0002716B69|nr:DUF6058 family natural product biosynthesis protein [Flavobacterium sp. CF136]EJL65921.1 hypothetical protein PMI10_01008 [Flavobacterium sp. CF136]
MKDVNLKYIEDNYLEFEEIIRIMNLTSHKLNQLIEVKLIPEPSYVVSSEVTISSSLNDNYKIVRSKKYFPKSILKLIEDNIENNNPEKFKSEFKETLLSNLKNHKHKTFAYGNTFVESGEIDLEKADKALEEEWNYFCKGIYGICTLQSNEEAIIEKEIAIKRILDFIENRGLAITQEKINHLKELNDAFNKYTSNFAPYQRETSSRGKYLDKLLTEFSLEDLIKKYE